MSQFRFEIEEAADRLLVVLHGELDLDSAEPFQRACTELLTRNGRPVVLDLRDLEFMDSTGLRSVLAVRERAAALGRPFAVVRGGRQVQRLLELTRVSEQLTTLEDPAGLVTG